MTKLKLTAVLLGLVFSINSSFAQSDSSQTEKNERSLSEEGNSRSTKFLLTGYAFAGYEKEKGEQSTFGPAGFSPIFLWKKSDKLFVESELEIEIEDGDLTFGLEYVTLHYKPSKYLSFGVGKFLSPFGTFAERLHPAWINKFSEKPLGFSEEGLMVGPMSEFGVELRGGAQLGDSKINYTGYVSNGPTLITGDIGKEEDPMMAGQLMFDNLGDNNSNKALGGRLGFLPFSKSNLEIGISGQTAKVGDKDDPTYENVGAKMFAADISYTKKIALLNVDLKAQFNQVKVDNASYKDTAGMDYAFDNKSNAYYAQLALRPVVLNKFFNKTELVGRYSALNTPTKAMWGGNKTQIAIGLNFWFNWNSVIKISYLSNQEKGQEDKPGFFLQLAFGF
jgi:hypothetical protein